VWLFFTLENLDGVAAVLGHDAAQEAIRSLGTIIDKHLGPIGGFSAAGGSTNSWPCFPIRMSGREKPFCRTLAGISRNREFAAFGRGKQAGGSGAVRRIHRSGRARAGQPFAAIDDVIDRAAYQKKEIWPLPVVARRNNE